MIFCPVNKPWEAEPEDQRYLNWDTVPEWVNETIMAIGVPYGRPSFSIDTWAYDLKMRGAPEKFFMWLGGEFDLNPPMMEYSQRMIEGKRCGFWLPLDKSLEHLPEHIINGWPVDLYCPENDKIYNLVVLTTSGWKWEPNRKGSSNLEGKSLPTVISHYRIPKNTLWENLYKY